MKIENLSISDLKAAYDFVLSYLKMLEDKAKNEGINPEQLDAYKEVKQTEDALYQKLQNSIRFLEK